MQIPRDLTAVAPLAAHLDRPLKVVDVGCRWGFSDAWAPLGRGVSLVGFDPDAAECERLSKLTPDGRDVRYVPVALGAVAGPSTLHLTREPACSSLYPPDEGVIARRPMLDLATPVGTTTVMLSTLDGWAEAERCGPIDFLKLDTQGSELDILRGGERVLREVRALEVEVEFNPIYRGQPLFGDVDAFLRRQGFVLWRLGQLVHYGMAGAHSAFPVPDHQAFDGRDVHYEAQGGQLTWGHAYFVRAEIADADEVLDWRAALRDALLLTTLRFRDLAGWALRQAARRAPDEVAEAIQATLIG